MPGLFGSGSTTSATNVPDWIKDPSVRQIQRAEDMQKVGYMPWHGPDIAAFNPTQMAAMQQNIGAAEAFGLQQPGTLTAAQGMPEATTYADGTQGYSGMPMYEQAKAEWAASAPTDAERYNALFS
ncbi:MAG: hypothetical protein NZ730_09680 [Porticoccaceae bacterium]|nr:hypothetical protein [Porticoccaceae bacterium]